MAALQMLSPAVKSLLQRARAKIGQAALHDADIAEPTDHGARRVLDRMSRRSSGPTGP